MRFYNSFIMHYTEYFTLRDCSRFLQIRSHTYVLICINVLDESSTSGSIDGVQNETTQAVDSRVRLLETDPLVLHVLPSTVSDDGKIQVYVRTFSMQTHLHACMHA